MTGSRSAEDRDTASLIRAFVAVTVPDGAARTLELLLTRLVPLGRLRWVTRAQLHVTLRFLGERTPDAIERVKRALAPIAFPPFEVELSRAGAFPSLERPRTLWLSGTRGAAELTALAARLEDALAEAGIPRERRPFVPHLTLARCTGEPLPPALLKALEKVPPVSWTCCGIELMRSRLTPRGAIYTPIPLEGVAP